MDRDRDGIEAQHGSVFQPHTSHTEHPRTHSRAAPTITPVAAANDAESSDLSMMMGTGGRRLYSLDTFANQHHMTDQMIPYVDMDQWTDNVVNITDLSLPKCGRLHLCLVQWFSTDRRSQLFQPKPPDFSVSNHVRLRLGPFQGISNESP